MRNDLYTILDNCLTLLDQGSDLESCLARYPEYAAELRPLLLASLDAAMLANNEVSSEVIRRNKSRVLNTAAEMREQKAVKKAVFFLPVKRIFRMSFAALITLILIAGIGGTGLVQASTVSLPGDQFYPVKLTWESILLKLAVSQANRDELEDRFELERVEEIEGLLTEMRSEKVKFLGQVEGIFPDQLIVSGIPVIITPDTRIDGDVRMNTWVRVEGLTTSAGSVRAEKIKVESLDEHGELEGPDSSSSGDDTPGESGKPEDNSPGSSPENEQDDAPETEKTDDQATKGSGSNDDQKTPKPISFDIEGTTAGYNGSSISVGNKLIFIVPETEIRGSLADGSRVSIRGFVNEEGALIALRIEVKSDSESGGGGGSGSGNSGGDDGDDPTKTPDPDGTPDD